MKKSVLIILLLLVSLSGFFSLFRDAPEPRPGRQQEPSLRMILLVDSIATVIRSPQRRAAAGRCLFSPADEALDKAFALLSAGNQVEAEEVVSWAVLKDLDNPDLLFAKAVLERSRWSKFVASECFLYLLNKAVEHPVIAAAADLSLQLDRGEFSGVNLTDLIRLSDENPDNLYLLWLSAIQCREQAKGELGKQQYEKLLSRFEVGPVMAHHTFANILTEYLEDYDEAMRHRRIAASQSNTGWVWQGMANTLRDMERFEESCEAWERCLALDPDDAKCWRQWAGTLYKMERYEEALLRYRNSVELEPDYAFTHYRMGMCNQKMKQYNAAWPAFERAADLGKPSAMYELGRCCQNGQGCKKDLQAAAGWYRRAADLDHVGGLLALAECYATGAGVNQNLETTKQIYRRLLELRPNDSVIRQKLRQVEQFGSSKDDDLASAAEQGDAVAQRKLAFQFQWGDAAFRNPELAVRWYRAAAEQDEVDALWRLARCYAEGTGTDVDEPAALACFERALELEPDSLTVWFSFARFLATCENDEIRDEKRATDLAEKAVAALENVTTLNVLSQVYAANGRYEDALVTSRRLAESWEKAHPDRELPPLFAERLNEYEQKAGAQR